MNTRQLELFRAILRDGSLTAAANRLGVSQPAATKLLQHLEDRLGYPLFERQAGRLQPTPEALLLAPDADHVLRGLDAFRDRARQVGARQVGLLRVGAALPIVWSVLPRALTAFRTAHPEASVHLLSLPARQTAEALQVGDIDLGLTLSPILAPSVRNELLAPLEAAVLLPRDHPLAARAELGPADLQGAPLISYPSQSGIGAALDEAFRSVGLVRVVSIEVASSVIAAPLVASGAGLALVDGFAGFDGLVHRPFRPRVAMQLCAATDALRPLPRLVAPFLTLLRGLI